MRKHRSHWKRQAEEHREEGGRGCRDRRGSDPHRIPYKRQGPKVQSRGGQGGPGGPGVGQLLPHFPMGFIFRTVGLCGEQGRRHLPHPRPAGLPHSPAPPSWSAAPPFPLALRAPGPLGLHPLRRLPLRTVEEVSAFPCPQRRRPLLPSPPPPTPCLHSFLFPSAAFPSRPLPSPPASQELSRACFPSYAVWLFLPGGIQNRTVKRQGVGKWGEGRERGR